MRGSPSPQAGAPEVDLSIDETRSQVSDEPMDITVVSEFAGTGMSRTISYLTLPTSTSLPASLVCTICRNDETGKA